MTRPPVREFVANVAGEARGQQHLLARPALEHELGKLEAVDPARHHQVGEDQVKFGTLLFKQHEGAIAVLGLDHAIAERNELLGSDGAHLAIVFDQQDTLASARQGAGLAPGWRDRARLGSPRQEDAHGRALAEAACNVDHSPRLMHEAMHHAEAEAGAVARALGGEKRLEDARPRRRVHADAGVGERDQHMVSRRIVFVACRCVAYLD